MRSAGSSTRWGAHSNERGTSAVAIVTGVALTVPFVAALVGFIGDDWFVTGDWASIHLRIQEVGSRETPLVGAYSTRGWAHPGPVVFWLGAPLDRLTGGDARSMLVTAALVNLAAIWALLHVVRRRGGVAMEVAAAIVVALLGYGLGPGRLVDIWNPILPLFSLLLLTFLTWSAATGERRHAIWAIGVGALVVQAHVGLIPIVATVFAWGLAWTFVAPKVDLGPPAEELERQPNGRRVAKLGGIVALVAWIPPMLDQLFGTANLAHVFGYFVLGHGRPVGLRRGLGLVSRYVLPHGPWSGGDEPHHGVSVLGAGALPTLFLVAALTAVSVLLWRRRERLALAGTTLALTVLVAAVPVASNVDEPVFDYLVKWLCVVGALGWFWLAWGTWRLVSPILAPVLDRRPVAWLPAATAVPVVIVITLASVPAATRLHYPASYEAKAVRSLRTQLDRKLPPDRPARIEHLGDLYGNVTSGVVYWLRHDGRDIVTQDGAPGQKYGPDARWSPDDGDLDVYTVVVHYPYDMTNRDAACREVGAIPVARYDALSKEQRLKLRRLSLMRLFHPERMTAAEWREGHVLGMADFTVTIYRWSDICAP